MHPTKDSLVKIIDQARAGHVVLPEFQRSFIWDRAAIEELLVSVFNGYFIGSLLSLDVVPHSVPFRARTIEGIDGVSPRPQKMVLDGQQRITSIHYALYGPDINLKSTSYPYRFFVNIEAALEGRWEEGVTSSPTYYKSVPTLYDDPTRQYEEGVIAFSALRGWQSWMKWYVGYQQFLESKGVLDQERLDQMTGLAERFLTYQVAVIEMPQQTPLTTVVEVFERINRTGSPLGVFELLTARLWKDGIQLRDLWDKAIEAHPLLAGSADEKSERYPNFVLQVIALLRGKDCKRKDLILLQSDSFEEDWTRAASALEVALNRIHSTASGGYGVVPRLSAPYSTLATPLAVMLEHISSLRGERASAYDKVHHWYWSSVFRERYGGSTETLSQRDVTQLRRWIDDDSTVPEAVPTHQDQIQRSLADVVRAGAVYRGVLSLVALRGARDFFSGDSIELHQLDDHHIFPASFLSGQGVPPDGRNTILNRTLISSDTNRRIIGAKRPSAYLAEMEQQLGGDRVRQLLATHFINDAAIEAMRSDDYARFLAEREKSLRAEVVRRCVFSTIGALVEPDGEFSVGAEDQRLDRLEAALRDLLDEGLEEVAGDRYWKQLVPQDIKSAVKGRISAQQQLHPRAGTPQRVSNRTRLDFCDFSDYETLLLRKDIWPAFESVFLRSGELQRHLTSVRRYRNALKHGREIEPVERLAGQAGILWLERAIGQTRFLDRVSGGDEATIEDCLRVLVRRRIPDGQRRLYESLLAAGPDGIVKVELIESMGRRDASDLAGVLGALGNRINRTPGFGETHSPGVGMVLELDDAGVFRLRQVMVDALRQLSPPWLSDADLARWQQPDMPLADEPVRQADHRGIRVTQMRSGTIRAERNGEELSPTKPVLRKIAAELGQSTVSESGRSYNTRQLGVRVIGRILRGSGDRDGTEEE